MSNATRTGFFLRNHAYGLIWGEADWFPALKSREP
jgi:hypothetical protein